MPIDPDQMMSLDVMAAAANQPAPDRYANWTNADWDAELRRMMKPVSRQTQDQVGMGQVGKPRWEYLFDDKWMNEDEFNDPSWRQNVYNPWAQGIHDEWRNKREDWERGKSQRGSSPFEQRSPPDRRSAGSMGSYSSGGARGGPAAMGSRSTRRRYDPAMIAQLIGG